MPRRKGRDTPERGAADRSGVRPGWAWVCTRPAQRQIDALSQEVRERIVAALDLLVVNPRGVDARKLEAQESYRLRVGDYRVIYDVDKSQRLFVVIWVGNRKDAYR